MLKELLMTNKSSQLRLLHIIIYTLFNFADANSGPMFMRFKAWCFELVLRGVVLVHSQVGTEFSANVWDWHLSLL